MKTFIIMDKDFMLKISRALGNAGIPSLKFFLINSAINNKILFLPIRLSCMTIVQLVNQKSLVHGK